jgi:glyoxylase-like metal-dependent hydrolase (beta-lactamase superfamily II)
MVKYKEIREKVYQVGGSNLSDPRDAAVFLIDVGNGSSVLIDSGAGGSFVQLCENIRYIGIELKNLKALILTHCHIDHIGSASMFVDHFGCDVIAHNLDAEAIEGKDDSKTAAEWYGVEYKPVKIDTVLTKPLETLKISNVELNCLHTPGHTPGSISVYCDIAGKRILFGQDIHGPFDASFGSDIEQWKHSMQKLIDLKADILCEGHFGIFQPAKKVKKYIEGYLRQY